MLNDLSTPLSFLQTRRSARPRDLVAPGPDADQLETILRIASRIPDHGKLHPWRFVHVPRETRAAFAELLHRAYREERPDPGRLEIEATEKFAHQAPTLIVALSCPVVPHKIPVWEQQLSCGAACLALLAGAHALGFAGGWVTGWAAYSEAVRDAFGSTDERIAAFIFLGTPDVPLEERPRPELSEVSSEWTPDR
ncbi:nitroreductase family protein [Allosphingosinicella sp.]|uniref:nitroreductase family protein n=1 Tax=Allosphingosinicella sp. TaxID=2823234 RepID=UPI002FC11985